MGIAAVDCGEEEEICEELFVYKVPKIYYYSEELDRDS
jgi:hypothetical protein